MSESKIPPNPSCCHWSKYNGGCGDPCDFKTLPYEKEAILERMQTEAKWLKDQRESISAKMDVKMAESIFFQISDKIKGIQIMVERLKADFGMTDKELRSIMKTKQDPIASAKLALALTKLQLKRKPK